MDWKPLIAILFVGLLLFGCTQPGSGPSASPATGTSISGSALATSGPDSGTGAVVGKTQASISESSVLEINMTAKQFEFSPSVITVKKGQKVRINLSSPDVAHSFAAPDFKVNVRVEGGDTAIAEFVPDKAGTFDFRCFVPCGAGHKEMRGQIVVTE
ncbi:cupredoxin domain-containing protein [Candidatus Micrarchaeota archaeon]|nr:cupredoxin domain-containing protein [Candidatus Micrarchaeota archaeon]